MSVVTGVTLVCSLSEESNSDEEPPLIIEKMNEWLFAQKFGPLAMVDDMAGGDKHPQCYIFCAGYNHFPEDDFAKLFLNQEWEYPENAVLVMQPENGPTRVFLPGIRP